MEQRVFAFSIITKSTTEKVMQFIMPLKSVYNKNKVSLNKKCIFEHYREIQTNKRLLIDVIFVTKNIF